MLKIKRGRCSMVVLTEGMSRFEDSTSDLDSEVPKILSFTLDSLLLLHQPINSANAKRAKTNFS